MARLVAPMMAGWVDPAVMMGCPPGYSLPPHTRHSPMLAGVVMVVIHPAIAVAGLRTIAAAVMVEVGAALVDQAGSGVEAGSHLDPHPHHHR